MKWWYKLVVWQVSTQAIKARTGCQRKFWSRIFNDLLSSLGLNNAERVVFRRVRTTKKVLMSSRASARSVLGMDLNILRAFLFWVLSCGRMIVVLCFDLVQDYVVDMLKLRKSLR